MNRSARCYWPSEALTWQRSYRCFYRVLLQMVNSGTTSTKKYSYTIRKNTNSPNLQQATMQIGKWPHFRILRSGPTFLRSRKAGFFRFAWSLKLSKKIFWINKAKRFAKQQRSNVIATLRLLLFLAPRVKWLSEEKSYSGELLTAVGPL